MTGNLKLLCNFVEKFLGTVRFGNDQFAPILGYGDLNQGNVTIKRVYYVEGLNHNLFSVGQFCDADLEVAFRKSTCFCGEIFREMIYLHGIVDLILPNFSSRNINFINLRSVAWLKLLQLKHVKQKRSSFKSKAVPSSKGRLNLLHMDLCGPMRVASINGKKYILRHRVLEQDTPWLIQRRSSKLPLSFWAEAVATAWYSQNNSIIISTHGKTAFQIIMTESFIKTSSLL
ncbi:hypothetical protein Tco_0004768 [Tanacetum coccineum]